MEADDEMEAFVAETYAAFEIDLDYEFDAPRYYDFTRPETESEDREDWFESTGSYPPSPFAVKLNGLKGIQCASAEHAGKANCGPTDSEGSEVSVVDDNNSGVQLSAFTTQDIRKAKMKPPVKSKISKISTLMKPTASFLAKQSHSRGMHSYRVPHRFRSNLSYSDGKSSQCSSVTDILANKRQRLEAGYLCKVSQLKHQPQLLHKVSRKARVNEANSALAGLRVTIPKEPRLETANRAQRHRSRINAGPGANVKSNISAFKACPLNRTIIDAPLLSPQKKNPPQMSKFQVDTLLTDRTFQNASLDSQRQNSICSRSQEKCGTIDRIEGRPLYNKEFNFPLHETFLEEPPTELLSQLSLESEPQHGSKFQCKLVAPQKGSKENRPDSFHQELKAMNLLQRKAVEVHSIHGTMSVEVTESDSKIELLP